MTSADRDTVYVSETPSRMFGNILIEGPDGQCIYIYAGIEERCQNEAVAHTYIERGGEETAVEMCAEHAPEDVPEPPSTEQAELVTDGGMDSDRSFTPVHEKRNLDLPPTDHGATFTLKDIGTDDGGTAVSAIRAAFMDTWGDVALVLEDQYGQLQVYAFLDGASIMLCHVSDEVFDKDEHGIQTNGIRYSYEFMRSLESTPFIAVVPWDQTRFTEVVAEEVWYP